ncbi:UNVERIFIED_CONTAM: hypothetical protein PYX00_002982 [Menopon gallinae]|uniref:Uncharacterized protein n=1 Tax=Menopon gallinae TaxID=328185 RepID=A0AAW2HZ91_9NEOP
MASEALQILSLSPIPELSEMELSTMFEQLSGITDPNGEIADRNVEDILREAEEIMESISSKPESKPYLEKNKSSDDHSKKTNSSSTGDKYDDCESINDVLNLSAYSEDESKRSAVSESNKNERDSSQTELSSRSCKSMTNHIKVALDSLKECSEKIENQTRNSPHKNEESSEVSLVNSLTNEDEKELKKFSFRKIDKSSNENKPLIKMPKKNVKPSLDSARKIKSPVKGLSLSESIKTLDCFERLYRGKPARFKIDNRKLKQSEKISEKKIGSGKVVQTMNPTVHKEKKIRKRNPNFLSIKNKPYCSMEFDEGGSGDATHCVDSLTDEEISFEKCLRLLNEDSPSNITDFTTNQTDFTEKILKQCTATFSALQEDVEDLKTQLRRNAAKDSLPNWDSSLTRKFSSQENLIRLLKEENSKLFKEIEEIKVCFLDYLRKEHHFYMYVYKLISFPEMKHYCAL